MAQIPFQNFAFTDPVAAQQAVQMGQLLALSQAEKDRNMAQFAQEELRGRRAQQTAMQNAAQQRALTESQMRQQVAEAEKNRQARAAETSQVLQSQEKVAGLRNTARADMDQASQKFDNLAALIDTEDPPTDSEFNALSSGLSPDFIAPLKLALEQKRRSLTALAAEAKQLADYWNRIFDDVKVGEDAKMKAAQELYMKDRRANELLAKDPRFPMRFLPKYMGPRLDATSTPGVTPISELRARLAPPDVGLENPANAIQPGGIFNLRVPSVAPASPEFAVPMPMY